MMMSSRRLGHGIASLAAPPALSLASFLLMLTVTLIPPDFYETLMIEPDLMFLNLGVIGMFIAYWAVFLAGYFMASKLKVSVLPRSFQLRSFSGVAGLIITALIVLEIICFAYSFHVLYARIPDLIGNFFSGNVQRTKRELMQRGTSGSFSIIVPISNGTFWWMFFRREAISRSVSPFFRRYVLWPLVGLLSAIVLTYSSLLGSRYEIVPLLFGLMVSFYVKKKLENTPFTRGERMLMLFFPAFLVSIFIAFSMLRGDTDSTGLMTSMMGYGPASYNRFAAVLNGTLVYDDKYGILNEIEFLFHFPFEQRLIDINTLFDLPQENWITLYTEQVGAAHLVHDYMWSSLFGQIYSDMGLFSFLYMFIYGATAAILWKLFTRKRVVGILIYPWLAFSIFMWFGYDGFTSQDLSALIVMSAVFILFEKYCARV